MADSEVFVSADGRSPVPFRSLTDDVDSIPGLANLCTDLRRHIDSSGMSITLAKPLKEARDLLQAQRTICLKSAILYWCLRDILMPGADPYLQHKEFLEVLEQQLLVTELKLAVNLCSSKPNVYPSILGMETQHLTQFLPPHQDLEQMQKKLPAKVGKFLKATCVQLLSYCNPDCATEKQHLREARAQQEELKDRLYKKKALYLKVLLHCLGLLKQMACKFRLEIQSSLDQFKTKYFMVKCNAYFLKFCDNEMEILSETYTPEVVNVHRTIRVLLEYEIMGPEFEKVVEVYTKLHEKIKTHRWMLAELNK
ncbi:hypothetical protein E2320_003597 [Naja naja]|nr:hypothetical protein E2320_003597 [Naja naja]